MRLQRIDPSRAKDWQRMCVRCSQFFQEADLYAKGIGDMLDDVYCADCKHGFETGRLQVIPRVDPVKYWNPMDLVISLKRGKNAKRRRKKK